MFPFGYAYGPSCMPKAPPIQRQCMHALCETRMQKAGSENKKPEPALTELANSLVNDEMSQPSAAKRKSQLL